MSTTTDPGSKNLWIIAGIVVLAIAIFAIIAMRKPKPEQLDHFIPSKLPDDDAAYDSPEVKKEKAEEKKASTPVMDIKLANGAKISKEYGGFKPHELLEMGMNKKIVQRTIEVHMAMMDPNVRLESLMTKLCTPVSGYDSPTSLMNIQTAYVSMFGNSVSKEYSLVDNLNRIPDQFHKLRIIKTNLNKFIDGVH